MKIEKANLAVGEGTLQITLPFQKVNKSKRIVSGFATTNSVDKHGDVVTKEASKKAFAEFLGNLRLMHQPIPAGKVLNFREEQYFDKATNKVYDGIYVDAYVSEGAENVWKMVLDGTLTGFSIGGDEVVAEPAFDKEAGKPIRKVTSYRMHELSLVDNPANAFSNIISIQKLADGGVTAEGTLADVVVENVYYCKSKDHEEPVAQISAEESKDCMDCGSPMKNIGWFESDGGDKAEKVNAIVKKFESTEGGENMPQEENTSEKSATEEKVEEVNEPTKVDSVEDATPRGDEEVVAPEGEDAKTATVVEDGNLTVSTTGTGEAKVEEAKEVVKPETAEGEVAENPLTKMFDELKATLSEGLEKNSQSLAEVTSSFEKKLDELSGRHGDLSEKFGALNEKLDSVEKRFEGIEKSGALKKSADLGGEAVSPVKDSKPKWGGVFSVSGL